jgi:hypothetical protein
MAVSARGVEIGDNAAEPHQPNVKAKASTPGSRYSIWTWRRLPHADISQEAPEWSTDGGSEDRSEHWSAHLHDRALFCIAIGFVAPA